ncbi:hypothetical protein [Geotoga petraea]|uniref:Uncharacterized protein n=1 Tax=Geotoga petraea TaxID=28234 RepID=A0A1G6M522_9BACT|nr:hypothetical protein [Geotoga petraea]SDC50056.1 hypothetical protein SAMN04488588_1226 [Geotoga petraea]
MQFNCLLFTEKGNYYTTEKYDFINNDTIIFKDVFPEQEDEISSNSGFIGYFMVGEDDGSISYIRRFLKADFRKKKFLKTLYVDFISDEVRDLYGDHIEIISKHIGLRNTISSFNNLIKTKDVLANYDYWIDNISKTLPGKNRDAISSRITKFVNLYLIRIYERLYGKNIDLLIEHESAITYKILEKSIMQKTL